ncbi:MAG: hypothetical protein GF409_07545 [Candidatus Omnitrophica bacterium]|nr:hypothetical protein [Candidatus Omnitrophota bacterium]
MKIIIVGLGETGSKLAEILTEKKETSLVLIDQDEKRTEEVSETLDAVVLTGDGSDPEVLKEAAIEEADALVATTNQDAINTVIAMVGAQRKVKKIIVKLKSLSLRSACEEIGDVKIISPHISAAREIMQLLQESKEEDISNIIGGKFLLETVDTENNTGKKILELELPEQALILAVTRGNEVLFPKKNTVLEEGDSIAVLSEDRKTQDKVKALFAK